MDLVKSKKKIGKPGIKLFKKLYNPSLKITVLLLIFLLSFSVLLSISGCKKKAASETATAASASASTAPESLAAASTSGSDQSSSATTESSSATQESATESTEAIPSDITALIKKADGYYASGEYGLAKTTYRKAVIAIDASGLSDEAKQQLTDLFQGNYNKSKNIVETVLLHYSNAMQLQYETNYKEEKKELEAALAIYPKYAEAQEAYENLKAMMGLE